jgi:hypothetical protein
MLVDSRLRQLHLAKSEIFQRKLILGSFVNGLLDSGWLSVCSSASLALQCWARHQVLSQHLVAANSARPLELAVFSLKSCHLRCRVFTSKSTCTPKRHLVERCCLAFMLDSGGVAKAASARTSRKMQPDQEKPFLGYLVRPEDKPIGGEGDGVMERKVETRVPLLEEFRPELHMPVFGHIRKL